MKKLLCILLFLPFSKITIAQQKDFDSTALIILDRMTDVIGDLSSCRFTVHITTDRPDNEMGVTTHFTNDDVYMAGPNKMLVNVQGDKGHRQYLYNGTNLSYYSYDENNFATIDAPPTILQAMDSISKAYGIDFPAADFFYPTFTDDFLNDNDQISYLGTTDVDGKECFHILGKNKDMTTQIWIANDATNLPVRFLMSYTNNKEVSRYEAGFSEWQLNPDLPVSMFNFLPPPSATEVYLLPKKVQ